MRYICEDNALANLVKISRLSIILQNKHPTEKASYMVFWPNSAQFFQSVLYWRHQNHFKKIILFPMCNDLVQKLMHYDNKVCGNTVPKTFNTDPNGKAYLTF